MILIILSLPLMFWLVFFMVPSVLVRRIPVSLESDTGKKIPN